MGAVVCTSAVFCVSRGVIVTVREFPMPALSRDKRTRAVAISRNRLFSGIAPLSLRSVIQIITKSDR